MTEVVTTNHNKDSYIFQFIASPDNFDNPSLTQIRQHMFNSIKWLGSLHQGYMISEKMLPSLPKA